MNGQINYERLWFKTRHWAEKNNVDELLGCMQKIEQSLMSLVPEQSPFMAAWFRLRNSKEGKAQAETLREFEEIELRSEKEQTQDMVDQMREMLESLGRGLSFGELPGGDDEVS